MMTGLKISSKRQFFIFIQLSAIASSNSGRDLESTRVEFTFKRLLNVWEVTRVTELVNLLESFKGTTEQEDSLVWERNNNKVFSVKSAYGCKTGLDYIILGIDIERTSGR